MNGDDKDEGGNQHERVRLFLFVPKYTPGKALFIDDNNMAS